MPRRMVAFFIAIFLGFGHFHAQTLKIYLLYGSKPLRGCETAGGKWFGGKWGGHVGISVNDGPILSFVPEGKLHWHAKRNSPNSKFIRQDEAQFYGIFGGQMDSVKRASIFVPISQASAAKFDSVTAQYLRNTPYDYAFWGMRCASAAYEILDQLDVVEPISRRKVFRKVFYPKVFRRRIFRQAEENGWKIEHHPGSPCRKWDRG